MGLVLFHLNCGRAASPSAALEDEGRLDHQLMRPSGPRWASLAVTALDIVASSSPAAHPQQAFVAEAALVEGGINLFRQPQMIVAIIIGSGIRMPTYCCHLEVSALTRNAHSVANRIALH